MSDRTDPRIRLIGRFRAVVRERVAALDSGFGSLEQGGGDPPAVDAVMREIHTLKGEARLMGFLHVSEIAHAVEDLLAWARERNFAVPGEAADLVYQGLDLLLAHVAEEADESGLEGGRGDFLLRVHEFLDRAADDVPPGPTLMETQPLAEPGEVAPVGGGLGDFIRIPSDALVALTELTGEVIIHEGAIARLAQELWTRVRESPSAPIELVDAVRDLREEVFHVRLRSDELQDSIRNLRLLAVSSLFERYPAAIRELARERDKQVRVSVEAGEVAVDKQVLDRVDEAILHLVRNSIDHGIEAPAERAAAGKSERGMLVLAARQVGSQVEIEVRDDGRGISAAEVRQAAIARQVISEQDVGSLDDDAALRLVFRPGFSTRRIASDISGRGVGLDVVNDAVRSLGGSVKLVTRPGVGTSFTLTVPISIALVRTLCFRSGAVLFGIPSASVQRVLRSATELLDKAGAGLALKVDGAAVPLVDLRRAAGAGGAVEREVDVVVLEHAGVRLGLMVDGFVGERELVQRRLGAFLGGLRLLSGTGIIDRGQVVLLMSVPEIAQRWAAGESLMQALPIEAPSAPDWRVLVVDDSELTRDMLVSLARRRHLQVVEAVNGREALSKIASEPPDLILTDLDMPVMDGFELISRVRADPRLCDTPVIVLTTRGSDDDKRRAMTAGADAYLIKTDFTEEALGAAIARFRSPARGTAKARR